MDSASPTTPAQRTAQRVRRWLARNRATATAVFVIAPFVIWAWLEALVSR